MIRENSMYSPIDVLIVVFLTGAALFVWAHSPQIVQTVFGWISPSMPSLPTISTPPPPMSVTFGWADTIPTPWLFWETESGHENGKLCKSFVGTDVRFDTSTRYLDKFGCSMIARCRGGGVGSDQDVVLDFQPMTIRVFLGSYGRVINKKGKRVYGCNKLTLLADQRMYASGVKYK
jgi:hypothetical protein